MAAKSKCGICGRAKELVKTACCGHWICERLSCYEKHDRFTLCGNHYHNQHAGHWQDCEKCVAMFPAEMSAWYGTNEFNFEKMKKPPAFQPTQCSSCGVVIKLSEGGYSKLGPDHWYINCR